MNQKNLPLHSLNGIEILHIYNIQNSFESKEGDAYKHKKSKILNLHFNLSTNPIQRIQNNL